MTIMFAKKWKFSVSFLLLLLLCSAAGSKVSAASPHNFKNVKSQLKWPPEGQRLRFPITRDTSISSVGKERKGSNGGAAKVKLKGQQEFILFNFDTSPLKGRIITGALLHLRSASPEKAPLIRVGVSSIASPWEEGFSRWYLPLPGSACFLQAEYKRQDWAFPGSTFMNVSFGQGHTIWKFAECTPPDDKNWQTFAVDPDVIAARMTGLSYGFSAYDEVGHTWSITDGKFEYSIFPNRFCCSRESGNNAPWIEIWANGTDTVPPDTVRAVQVKNDNFPSGEALVSWQTPEDHGGGKTLGFHVSCKKGNSEIPIPRYLIPMAEEPGQEVRMHIQDLPFGAGEKIVLSVSPVDSAGNIGRPFSKEVTLSKGQGKIKIPQVEISPFPPALELPEIKGVKIFITDMLDKVNPNTGQMIPPRPSDYRSGNHLYSASEKIIRLQSARNETLGFQLHVEGASKDTAIKIEYDFEQNPNLKPKVYRFGNVSIFNKKGKAVSELPDPLIPLKAESKGWKISESEKKYLSLLCELYIPHVEPSGNKTGRLSISAGKEKIEFSVNLNVWNFTLPNKLSFIPEMNAYGTVSPYKGYDYYRLAHEHRTCINRLPYGWSGQVEFAPEWNGSRFDWKKWDQKVSPLLDGTAFADLPREGEPVDVFYLPFNENWPVSLFEHFTPSYWADEAFTPQYRHELMNAFKAFADHCREKKWNDTIFQFYLNNKTYYRNKYSKSSAPWVFDEPINTQDFWALRWYGILWHSAVAPVTGKSKMWYRGDISYSQFSRNILWGIMDVTYLGGNNAQKMRMKHDENIRWEKSYFAEYGSANKIDNSNLQPVLWCLSAWSKGAMAVLPWQTVGSNGSWNKADQNALFYPLPEGPVPSVRLKAFTRGQQDVEYLTLLCDVLNKKQSDAAEWLRNALNLEGRIEKNSENDAGTIRFDRVDVISLWKFRNRIGEFLSSKAPDCKRVLVNWELPKRDMQHLPDVGYVHPAPFVESRKPRCDTFTPVDAK